MRSAGLLWGRNLIERENADKEKRTCAGTSLGGLISQHYCLNPFYYFDELNISNPVPYADTATSRRKVMP